MKFGLALPLGRIHPRGEFQFAEAVREIALAVERAGVSGASLSEHPAPDAEWLHNDPAAHDALDPMTALAFVAAATKRLAVFTNVLVLPYRNPFLTAKAAATLQVLSDHRLILGVGVGYQKAEFEALGVPFRQRGALTDEALETIKLAWQGGSVVKQGRSFNAVGNEPRPVPSPPPPIWVGGASDKALERAARWGDGWIPHFSVPTNDPVVMQSSMVSMEDFAKKVDWLKESREKIGRSGPFDIAPGSLFRPKTTTRSDAEQFLSGCRGRSRASSAVPQIPFRRYFAAELVRQCLCSGAQRVLECRKPGSFQSAADADGDKCVAQLRARPPDGRRDHCHSGYVVACVHGKPLDVCLVNLRFPFIKCRRLIPAKLPEPAFQFGFGVISKCRNAPARGADKRWKAAADLRTQLKVLPRLGYCHDDDMVEADDMHSKHRDIEGLADAIQHGLGKIGELVTSEPVSREREHARFQRIAFGIGIERDELFGDQRSEHVQAGARYQTKLACDGLHAERRIAFSE